MDISTEDLSIQENCTSELECATDVNDQISECIVLESIQNTLSTLVDRVERLEALFEQRLSRLETKLDSIVS